ncbi:probable bifunctional dTTP/UTP pyrophosphatase/methyltransferase protein [Amblyraja radiata]|uniref:probable bifunctional dTTP/UTP pyrophosphatase/methyltransferase protein n=1 Tax=Amblyraja radiata TaxID=386614 RepID=UPI001401D494|nr:probable bifunctional dTTP/UTP pyrophosphatase/methyltransferase protein [Amblyraja radiata]
MQQSGARLHQAPLQAAEGMDCTRPTAVEQRRRMSRLPDLVVPGNQLETNVTLFHEETKVKFSELAEELLWEYIHSGEPMDKAGGYGIQALGGMLVEYVHGDFLNVVGFPLNHFCKKLAEINSSLESQSTASNATPSGSVNQDKMMDAEKGLKSDQTTPMEAEPKGLGATPQNATSEARESEVPDSLPRTSGHVEMNEGLLKVADLVDGFKASKVQKLHCEQNLFWPSEPFSPKMEISNIKVREEVCRASLFYAEGGMCLHCADRDVGGGRYDSGIYKTFG